MLNIFKLILVAGQYLFSLYPNNSVLFSLLLEIFIFCCCFFSSNFLWEPSWKTPQSWKLNEKVTTSPLFEWFQHCILQRVLYPRWSAQNELCLNIFWEHRTLLLLEAHDCVSMLKTLGRSSSRSHAEVFSEMIWHRNLLFYPQIKTLFFASEGWLFFILVVWMLH